MKSLPVCIIFLVLVLSAAAQDRWTIEVIDSLLKQPKTCILLREDGSVWAVAAFQSQGLLSDTCFIIVPDSSLVSSRLAHDDAIAKDRAKHPQIYFDEKFITPEQKSLLEKK